MAFSAVEDRPDRPALTADHAALAGAGGLAPCAADDLDCRAFTGTLAWRPDEARPLLSSKSLRRLTLLRHKHVRHLVVVEGYFGAIRLHGEHVPAVALMGSSVSNEQVALLQEHCPNLRAVTVMLDGGEAARTAADEVAARLTRRWWVRVADLPEGGQPDTVPETVLEKLLRRARPEAA